MKTFFLALTLAGGLFAQGLVDLKHLDRLAEKTSDVVNITLDANLIRLGAALLPGGDPDVGEVKKLLAGLAGISVRSYTFQREGDYTAADVDRIYQQLRGPGWNPVVEVKERGGRERTHLYVKSDGDKFAGVVIVSAKPTELTVVNIAGNIDPEKVAKLGGYLGIPEIRLRGEAPKPREKKPEDDEELR
jgi:hypothetical protein